MVFYFGHGGEAKQTKTFLIKVFNIDFPTVIIHFYKRQLLSFNWQCSIEQNKTDSPIDVHGENAEILVWFSAKSSFKFKYKY